MGEQAGERVLFRAGASGARAGVASTVARVMPLSQLQLKPLACSQSSLYIRSQQYYSSHWMTSV